MTNYLALAQRAKAKQQEDIDRTVMGILAEIPGLAEQASELGTMKFSIWESEGTNDDVFLRASRIVVNHCQNNDDYAGLWVIIEHVEHGPRLVGVFHPDWVV